MNKVETRRLIPFSQILLILMGIFVAYLVVSFVRQVGVSHQRRQELQQLEDKVDSALGVRAELEQQAVNAQSDEAVRRWALENGMTLADEVLVVIPGSDSAPATEENLERDASTTSPRGAWWDLFFGTR